MLYTPVLWMMSDDQRMLCLVEFTRWRHSLVAVLRGFAPYGAMLSCFVCHL